jgi:hypothetical protein
VPARFINDQYKMQMIKTMGNPKCRRTTKGCRQRRDWPAGLESFIAWPRRRDCLHNCVTGVKHRKHRHALRPQRIGAGIIPSLCITKCHPKLEKQCRKREIRLQNRSRHEFLN